MLAFPHDFESWVTWLTFLPLCAASVAGSVITVVKLIDFRQPNVFADHVRSELWALIEAQRIDEALSLTRAQPTTRGTHIVVALLEQATRSTELLRDRAVQVGGRLVRELERGLGGLALIATLGPLFGLWGTVVGIVLVFNRLAASGGTSNPQDLAGGIGTALYTTIVGIAIGILALVFHRYFSTRADRCTAELEQLGLDLIDRLVGRRL